MTPMFALLDSPVMMLLLGAIAVMLFGDRLPEVAKSIGKQVMELKNGVRNVQREIEHAVNSATTVDTTSTTSTARKTEPSIEREEATAPKFDPPSVE